MTSPLVMVKARPVSSMHINLGHSDKPGVDSQIAKTSDEASGSQNYEKGVKKNGK